MGEEIRWDDNPDGGECDDEEYLAVIEILRKLIDNSISEDLEIVIETKNGESKIAEPLIKSSNDWPTCGSVNIRNAQECIERLMTEWKTMPGLTDWMYNVEFIAMKADESSDFFLYEIKWSIPTPEYPIPQVTASVFFSIEAKRIVPKSDPVKVTYVFEGSQFVHRPEIPFRQKWLYDILDIKTLMFKSFKF